VVERGSLETFAIERQRLKAFGPRFPQCLAVLLAADASEYRHPSASNRSAAA